MEGTLSTQLEKAKKGVGGHLCQEIHPHQVCEGLRGYLGTSALLP